MEGKQLHEVYPRSQADLTELTAKAAATPGKVLVTGASGYIASHIIKILLEHGFAVRGTVRNVANRDSYSHVLELKDRIAAKLDKKPDLEFVSADLNRDEGWAQAVQGCWAVFHTASPFPAEAPKDENELIRPAVDGTLRVLRACAATRGAVKRVVLTSSVASVSAGRNESHVFDEKDFSDVRKCQPYPKSKTLAEQAAWKFVRELDADNKFELTTVNPSYVQGPVFTAKAATSHELIRKYLNKEVPGAARVSMNIVDVRDVALAHVRALVVPEAAGRRFIVDGGGAWIGDIAKVLAAEFDPKGYSVPTMNLPYCLVWLVSRCDKSIQSVLEQWNRQTVYDTTPAQQLLGIRFRAMPRSVVDMAYTCIKHGLVKNKLPKNFHIGPESD